MTVPGDLPPDEPADRPDLRLAANPRANVGGKAAGDIEDHAARCPSWAPPCPDGAPIELRHALGFRERELKRVELRVDLGPGDSGACQVVFREYESEVRVRVFVHRDAAPSRGDDRDVVNCPVRFWLARRLGWRAVVDHDTDQELPLYVPGDLDVDGRRNPSFRAVNRSGRDPARQAVPLGPIYHYWR